MEIIDISMYSLFAVGILFYSCLTDECQCREEVQEIMGTGSIRLGSCPSVLIVLFTIFFRGFSERSTIMAILGLCLKE